MRKKTGIALGITYSLITVPVLTFAAKISTYGGTDIQVFLKMIRTWFLGFAGALAVLFIIIGGIEFIASAGNPQRLEGAKKTLTYAIIGLVIVLLSTVILNLIAGDLVGGVFSGAGTSPY
jgi:type IV secretory pathway VirB2 component (pilin)